MAICESTQFLGFREQLQIQSRPILQKIFQGIGISKEDGEILREFWECAKFGNLLVDEIENLTGWRSRDDIESVLNVNGFLSKREKWYSSRLKKREIIVYRGASESECSSGEYGFSWTLNQVVAHFFAGRHENGKVMKAKIKGGIWLETCESEIIALYVEKSDILSVESIKKVSIDWESIRSLNPL